MGIRRPGLVAVLIMMVLVGGLPLPAVLAMDGHGPLPVGSGQQLAQPIVIVNTAFLNVRSGPGAIYSIIGTLPGGTELGVIGRNRDSSWWQVQSVFGAGWVSAEFVIPRGDFRAVPVVQATGTLTQPRAAVVGNPVKVYVTPDSTAALLGLALLGSELPISGKSADGVWWQVETNVGLGWVMQEDVALRGDASVVPVVSAQPLPGITAPTGGQTAGAYGRPVALHYGEGDMQIKRSPDPDAEGVGVLRSGDRVEVLDYSDDGEWILILYMGDRLGWIRADSVAISDPTDWRTQVWFDGPGVLDLKEQPTLASRTLAMVPENQRLVVVNDADGGWLQVAYGNSVGWIPSWTIEIIRNGPRTAPAGATTGAQLSGNIAQPSATTLLPAPQPEPVRSYVIVNTSYLNIRSGPGANYTVVATVPGGTELDITASTPDRIWFQVRGAFGSGWVNSEFVIFRGVFANVPILRYAEVAGETTGAEVIVSSPVNVYMGRGVDSGVLGIAPLGLTLPVIGRTLDGSWLQVQTALGPGWVLASTVTVRGNIGQVPIVS